MRLTLRMAACAIAFALAAGVLLPPAAADEAALRRTAPDECLVWFSWAGFDALGQADADTKNRTEQLLADEEVQAFLNSLAKSCGAAIGENADENTQAVLKILRTLAARPSVVFFSKVEKVKRQPPLRAPAPESQPAPDSAAPTTQAAAAPKVQVTVGDDGLERVGIDFEAPAGTPDPAQLNSPHNVQPATALAPTVWPNYGKRRTTGPVWNRRKEVELIWPHGSEWVEIDFDYALDKCVPSKSRSEQCICGALHSWPYVGRIANSVDTAIWVARQSYGPTAGEYDPHGDDRLGVELDDGRVGVVFDFDLDAPNAKAEPPAPPTTPAEIDTLIVELLTGTLTEGSTPSGVEIAPPQSISSPYPAAPIDIDLSDIVVETTTGSESLPPPDCVLSPAVPECTECEAASNATVVHGGIVIHLGDRAAEMQAAIEQLAAAADTPAERPRKEIGGVEFVRLEGDQPSWFAIHNAYLILAFDEATAEQIVAGLAGKREVPAWLDALEKKLPVERTAARVHVKLDALLALADEPFEEETKAAARLLGLDQVSAISWAAGLDDVGTAVKTLIATRDGGDASALFDLFGAKGLTADDLRAIPKDATMAAAGKFDAKRIVEVGVKLAALEDGDAESAWEAAKRQLAEQMFIDLSKDIVEALGDTWTLHYAPSEGGLMATTFTLAVRDERRLTAALEKFALAANADAAYVRKFTYRGQDVYYWQGGEGGGSAAWCIRDGRLVVSLLPQTIKAYIARGERKETLADVPEVRNLLAAAGGAEADGAAGPLVLAYTDTRDILRWCYQYGSFLLPAIGQALAESSEASEFDLALHEIPSLAVIEQYFAPSITTISRSEAGLLIDSRQTVPMLSGVVALSTLTGVAGGAYELAFDDSDLDKVAEMAEAIGSWPLASFGSPNSWGPFEIEPKAEVLDAHYHHDHIPPALPDVPPSRYDTSTSNQPPAYYAPSPYPSTPYPASPPPPPPPIVPSDYQNTGVAPVWYEQSNDNSAKSPHPTIAPGVPSGKNVTTRHEPTGGTATYPNPFAAKPASPQQPQKKADAAQAPQPTEKAKPSDRPRRRLLRR